MKIDNTTYEVDLSDGKCQPIYVWEAPVRVWHWLMVVTMVTMIVTGYLIGRPLSSNMADTWQTYQFGYIRMLHFIAAFAFTGLFIYRIFWAFMGNRYARQIFLPPLWSWKFIKGIVNQALYYLFIKKSAPEYAAHNPLAAIAMFAFFVLGSFGIIITGFALYGQAFGAGTGWETLTGWVIPLFGDSQAVRTTHHALMYVFCLFMVAHLYMASREDIMGGATEMSAITNGLRMFKHAK
ncbi:Ni/Fe-hydrogenase, b-type cytochrome subunit [Mesosutterella sp. OilRF-GAM-744-9]|uniref:Ni/Fe-hydrogenase, b-type cytochrome subunit n=1 Tax=Mesosutterella porci TaxID=2915351 RepID=A0ABS9MS41_9BURK|nr:Ni/Fe-hydrogenase, b-type cytochrome subunit [Mesosutterella sp. oilRF-744-WT-GAM-9]MCG5031424.1 Ni/Fe-hydrogenase, b-type cytochrome subunit [Mesosutterella sp. oilRF-744-WT-GAM-9]MCI6529714.1 Ni/Fe-hydrogenase, b-type cytochrome subunit [Mesosutterella sp.]